MARRKPEPMNTQKTKIQPETVATAEAKCHSDQRLVSLSPCVPLGEYLKVYADRGQIDFHVRVNPANNTADSLEFYIRPADISGETKDYIIGTKGKSAAHVENVELCNRLLQMIGKDK